MPGTFFLNHGGSQLLSSRAFPIKVASGEDKGFGAFPYPLVGLAPAFRGLLRAPVCSALGSAFSEFSTHFGGLLMGFGYEEEQLGPRAQPFGVLVPLGVDPLGQLEGTHYPFAVALQWRGVPHAILPLTGGPLVQQLPQSPEPEDSGVLLFRAGLRFQPFGLGKVFGPHDLAAVFGLPRSSRAASHSVFLGFQTSSNTRSASGELLEGSGKGL
eukprot:11532256-Heterocapsa_arctica.AAC.1